VLNALLIILPYLLALLAIGGLAGSRLAPTTFWVSHSSVELALGPKPD